jgi:hypothetical protein
MAQKKKLKPKAKAQAKRKPAPKKKTVKARTKSLNRKPAKRLVKKTPVQPLDPVQPTIQQNTYDLLE